MNNLLFFHHNPGNKGSQKVQRNLSAPQLFFIAFASGWPACDTQRLVWGCQLCLREHS